jgi:dihydrofolate synthase/folylpolyglutamate synthase
MNPFEPSPFDRAAAEQFLFSRIDFERALHVPYSLRNFKLDRMTRLAERLGDPQAGMNIVHVAGTKGKGSTAAMIAAVLSAAGYRTGLYTSPHLQCVEERLAIDGRACSSDELVDLIERLRPIVLELDATEGPTYFEILTAMAFVYFADHRVDWAVLEVGMGGRLDSTNICQPAVSVITSISLDHTKQLGNTLAAIAREKAGIIKPGVPVVSGVVESEPRDIIRQIAREQNCPLVERTIDFDATYYPPTHLETTSTQATIDFDNRKQGQSQHLHELRLSLVGEHQAANAAVALATLEQLRGQGWHIDEAAVRRGLGHVSWPARVEVIARRPTVVLDAAHNVASMAALLATLEQSFSARRRILIFATTRDKPAAEMLAMLRPRFDHIILTRYQNNPRSFPETELAELVEPGSCLVCPTPTEAWQAARKLATADDLIVITGSFFIAAEMRSVIM